MRSGGIGCVLQVGIGIGAARTVISSAKCLKVSYMPFADWSASCQETHAGAVGLLLLRALIGEQRMRPW